MPIYSYKCSKCGHTFDITQSYSDSALKDCPSCKEKDVLKKVFGVASVIYKGSGYYCKDNSHSSGCSCSGCKN